MKGLSCQSSGFFDRKASEPQPELSQPSQPSQQPGAKVVLGHKWTNRSRTPLPRRGRHPAEPPAPSAEPSAELAPEEPREKGSEQAEGCQLFQLMMPKAKIKAKAMPRRPTPTKEDHEAELAADTPPAESQSPTSPVSSPSSPPRKALLRLWQKGGIVGLFRWVIGESSFVCNYQSSLNA